VLDWKKINNIGDVEMLRSNEIIPAMQTAVATVLIILFMTISGTIIKTLFGERWLRKYGKLFS